MELSILLARCRSGDELAWEALVRRFQGRVYGIAYHYTGRAEDAQDVAQEAISMSRKLMGWRPAGSIRKSNGWRTPGSG
jgi:DNA-directed RNA polymerase specialized sigma24 family protein